MNNKTPSIGKFIDKEEEQIFEAIERDDYQPKSVLTPEKLDEYRRVARNTINEKRIKISLRLPETDLERLKAKAMREGMPYQTMINSLIHKFVS